MSELLIIEKPSQVEELIHYCQTTKMASIDYETSDRRFETPEEYPLILGVSFQPGSSWILPLEHKDSPFKKTWKKHFKVFSKEVLENYGITKIAWNLKFEYKWGLRYGSFMKGRLFDGMLAKYCLDEERPHDLKDFVATFFPKYANYEDDIDPKVPWPQKDFLKLSKYCGIDADLTHRGMIYLENRLMEHGFYNLFRNLLMMMSRVLAESEYRGMFVDREYLEQLIIKYKALIAESEQKMMTNKAVVKYQKKAAQAFRNKMISQIQQEIEELEEEEGSERKIAFREAKIKKIAEGQPVGKKETYQGFNPGSPPQMGEFLYSKIGLGFKCTDFTETGKPSTAEETLLKFEKKDKSGFITQLLEYRGLEKIDGTYVRGMLPHLDFVDRVHATFHIHGTVTGRLSCVKPNLQNIPRGSTAADIKKMFIPPKGYLLVEVDYSQAELRVIAEVSNDKAMIDIFNRGYNIHVATGCKMVGKIDEYDRIKALLKIAEALPAADLQKPENKEYLYWVKQKKKGKSLNFSIVYQQGDDATAETLGCTVEEAAQFKKTYFAEFPGVKKWIDNQKKFAKKHGYVLSMFGRKRRLHDIHSEKGYLKAEAERQAVNAPIQGASGDFTLFSQVVIRDKILKGELPREVLQAYTVHDSIGFYMPPKIIHSVVPEIIRICDNPDTKKFFGFELKKVKMKVSPEVGKNWADLVEYDEKEDYSKWL